MPPEQSTIIDASREPSQHTEGILGIHLRAVFNYPPGNFKRSDGDIPKMSSDFGPQRQQNLRRNLAPATKLYCYRNILTNNNNWFFFLYSLVVCVNQKIPLGLNHAHILKNKRLLELQLLLLSWLLLALTSGGGNFAFAHYKITFKKRTQQLTTHLTWHLLHSFLLFHVLF